MFKRHENETPAERQARAARINRRVWNANKIIYGTLAVSAVVYMAAYVGTTYAMKDVLNALAEGFEQALEESKATVAA